MPNQETNVALNPAVQQYMTRIAGYVEGKDPMTVLRSSPDTLSRLIEGLPAEKLKQSPAAAKWSVIQILAHLAEVEIGSSWRYRQILESSGVTLTAFDQNKWEALSDYASWQPKESLEMFRLLRQSNLRMLDKLSADEWENFGMHVERGRMTLRDLVSQMAGHDLNHIEQIQKIVSGLRGE